MKFYQGGECYRRDGMIERLKIGIVFLSGAEDSLWDGRVGEAGSEEGLWGCGRVGVRVWVGQTEMSCPPHTHRRTDVSVLTYTNKFSPVPLNARSSPRLMTQTTPLSLPRDTRPVALLGSRGGALSGFE
ncbi:hypothetical protein E2C01_039900 [Portunus trituberculatus]|uniref:Uncharacterized protein n=1 Tax=Portunus trituberculatus TaxID=210409 RepID=A0A5B7FMH3_PORTR|nr:hypothetical protein [Portunus trituberculatus]